MQFDWTFPVKVVFGVGKFSQAFKHLRGFGKRVFIVTSNSFEKGPRRSVLDNLLKQLDSINVEYMVFSSIEANPRTSTVDLAAAKLREFKPKYVLALGGGSVMDSAKFLALLAENPGFIYEYAYKGSGQPMKPFQKALPIVCIPTVAATSSETDSYGVVTNWGVKRKVTIFGDPLLPTLSIIDPELTFSISAKQTIDGAFDMITHVMETYLSTARPAPLQDNLTEAIVETVIEALPLVLKNPHDAEARSQLSWCGALALSGVLSGRNGGFPIHALEHGLSAYTDVAHGRGLAMLLPRVMAFDSEKIPEKILRFNKKIFGTKETSNPLKALEHGLNTYMKNVGAWTMFSEILLPGQKVEEILENTIEHAFETGAILKRDQEPYLENSRNITKQDAREILSQCSI